MFFKMNSILKGCIDIEKKIKTSASKFGLSLIQILWPLSHKVI